MYSIGAKKFPIYISFGAFEETGEFSKEITYIDWGQDPKFDIRGWKDDYTKCSKGINLKENELRVLEELLKNEIKVSNEKSSSEQYKSEENDDAFDLENELLQ